MAGRFLIISCSLNPASRSHRLALESQTALKHLDRDGELVDLRDFDLPFCDGEDAYHADGVQQISGLIRNAPGVLIAAPVYNYDLNSAAKNLIELTGRVWKEKPVGFLCSAGGRSSYMAPIGLANSLMFDFRSWIIPRFVYATGADFAADGSITPQVMERIGDLASALVKLADAFQTDV